MRRGGLLCLVALLSLGFAPAPFPRAERTVKRDDVEALQGRWKMTRQESSGNPTSHEFEAEVKGNRWTFIYLQGGNRNGTIGYFFRLDQTASPRALEWRSQENGAGSFVGSYRLQGKTLTIVYNSGSIANDLHKRPTDFEGVVPHKMVFEFIGR